MNDNRQLKMAIFGIPECCRPSEEEENRQEYGCMDDITDRCQLDLPADITMAMERNIWKLFTTSPSGQLADKEEEDAQVLLTPGEFDVLEYNESRLIRLFCLL